MPVHSRPADQILAAARKLTQSIASTCSAPSLATVRATTGTRPGTPSSRSSPAARAPTRLYGFLRPGPRPACTHTSPTSRPCIADRLTIELRRPSPALSGVLVFHAQQAMVYQRLMDSETFALRANELGRSLVVDAVLAEREFQNAAIVVPTIALMDECRRRLARLRSEYKVITHGSQLPAERNLHVMTPERLLEVRNLPPIDFFVIDEFYKLDPRHCERAGPLNILFRQLLSTRAQFYLLGPNVTAMDGELGGSLPATFISTSFTTVVTEMESVNVPDEELPAALADACRRVGPQTLIFCRSPRRTRDVANWLLDRGIGGGENLADAADWVAAAYHPDWTVARALRHGIGIHHARLPRSLGHHMVRLFNEGRLPYLLVTSTLIEGVNTTARNVIVLDNKIASKKYDYFTFSNISGRSGRMNRHFIGRVVVFNPAPRKADLNVDIPVLSQSPGKVTDEILIQIPEDQLTAESRRRLDPYYAQNLVSIEALRRSKGTPPARQLDAARQLASAPGHWASAFRWNGSYPTAAQVRQLAELLVTLTGTDQAAKTSKQLGGRVNMLRHHQGDLRALIYEETSKGTAADTAVEDLLNFARNWAQFKIPAALTTSGSWPPKYSRSADSSPATPRSSPASWKTCSCRPSPPCWRSTAFRHPPRSFSRHRWHCTPRGASTTCSQGCASSKRPQGSCTHSSKKC